MQACACLNISECVHAQCLLPLQRILLSRRVCVCVRVQACVRMCISKCVDACPLPCAQCVRACTRKAPVRPYMCTQCCCGKHQAGTKYAVASTKHALLLQDLVSCP